jgi:tetratricopeptide (TPR) repeat protein
VSDAPDFGSTREFYTFEPALLAEELGEFRDLREVGKGSMGLVYEAFRKSDGQRVAIKLLPPSLTLTERALARFLREGRIMAHVRHPDIVEFYDQGSRGRFHWFVMEFVDGVTLQERLQVGPLPVRQSCQICAQVGRALQYAHERGVVHRDVKPGNIMLRTPLPADPAAAPRVAITDFGLARETGTGSMTDSGAIVGTPMYMAPELVLGGTANASTLSDVYSLGATLYTLVTGVPPFDGPTAQSVLKAVVEQEPRSPRRRRADLPAAVAAMILKAMAKDPADRYGSPQEFAEDLERFVRGERVLARRPGLVQRGLRFALQRPLPTFLAALVCTLLIGAFALVRQSRRSALQQGVAEAERWLAEAATSRDEQGRPRSELQKRDLLLAAVAAASAVLQRDDSFALAWFARAKARHRLGDYASAIQDLDHLERILGAASPELLLYRLEALRQSSDHLSVRRLQQDLTQLLRLDPGDRTRDLVAEHLIDMSRNLHGEERGEVLAKARAVLAPIADGDARVAVTRARLLELEGEREAALAVMREVRSRHRGDIYVHLQAAAMFERLGEQEEGLRELETARLLGRDPSLLADQTVGEVDVESFGAFLGEVERLLQAVGERPAGAAQPGNRSEPPPRK